MGASLKIVIAKVAERRELTKQLAATLAVLEDSSVRLGRARYARLRLTLLVAAQERVQGVIEVEQARRAAAAAKKEEARKTRTAKAGADAAAAALGMKKKAEKNAESKKEKAADAEGKRKLAEEAMAHELDKVGWSQCDHSMGASLSTSWTRLEI